MSSMVIVMLAFLLGCMAVAQTEAWTNSHNGTRTIHDKEPPASGVKQLFFTFGQILVGTFLLYYWGIQRKTKFFKDMTNDGPKSFQTIEQPVENDALDPNLWYIHGEAYDISGFMHRHPGGMRPLIVARGRDCTELFESYHSLTDKPREMLNKFRVPEKNLKNYVSMFNWDMNAKVNSFQVELRQRVREHLKNNESGNMCPPRILIGTMLWTIFTAWVTVKYYWTGAWWSCFLVPFMWWLSFIQAFHDASHFALSRNEWINGFFVHLYPYFTSPTTWDHQHVIGHHVFTNIFKKDPDLNHGAPYFRLHKRFRWRIFNAYQMYFCWVVWLVSTFWLSVYYDFTGVAGGIYHGILAYQKLSKTRLALHVFGRSAALFLTIGIPFTLFSFGKALLWSLTFHAIWGFCFMLITQVNHITESCLEGADLKNECWAIHQVTTSNDFSHRSLFWWFLSGGLNYQIEHHLFPGVNSNHLDGIVPIVKELCQKYGVKYNYSSTYFEAIYQYLKVVENGSKKNYE